MYDSLYGQATRLTPPRLTKRTVKTGTSIYQQRSTSATRNDRPAAFKRLDRPQLLATIVQLHPTTRPTSATSNDRPAAFYDSTDSHPHQTSSCISTTRPTPATLIEHPAAHIYDSTIPAIDITHLAEDPNTTATDFTYTFVNLTINLTITSPLFPSLSLAVITRTH